MSNRRLIRVAEVLRSEISRLISRERNLEGDLITITGIEVSPDLKQAFVYCTSLNKNLADDVLLGKLNATKSEWQREIGAKIKTKYTPRLTFRIDEAQRRGDKIIQLLDQLNVPKEQEN